MAHYLLSTLSTLIFQIKLYIASDVCIFTAIQVCVLLHVTSTYTRTVERHQTLCIVRCTTFSTSASFSDNTKGMGPRLLFQRLPLTAGSSKTGAPYEVLRYLSSNPGFWRQFAWIGAENDGVCLVCNMWSCFSLHYSGCSLRQRVTFSENGRSSKIPMWSDKLQVVAPSPKRNITRLTAPNCEPIAIAIIVKHG